MQFFDFWAKANGSAKGSAGHFDVSCFGYSNESLEDALRVAQQRAEKVATAMANGQPHDQGYYGHAHPLREEIIDSFTDGDQKIAIISRNHYGCLVLNTADVFFADVDKPAGADQRNPIASLLNVFGVATPAPPSFEQKLIENIKHHCLRDAFLGLRLYRTTNGYRIIVTNRTVPAHAQESRNLLNSLGADGLYVSLCRSQDCYRARLTPKPWRCGAARPPYRFPFDSEVERQANQDWEKSYQSVIHGYATCALIGQFGSSRIDPTVDKIIQLHDHYVLNADQPIA